MSQWGLSGTPVSFILEPDGTVAWNKNKHQGQGGDGEELSADRDWWVVNNGCYYRSTDDFPTGDSGVFNTYS